jgi:hypothetical protein
MRLPNLFCNSESTNWKMYLLSGALQRLNIRQYFEVSGVRWTRNLILITAGSKFNLFVGEMVLLEVKILFADNTIISLCGKKHQAGFFNFEGRNIVHLNCFVIIMKISKLLKLETCMIGCREMLRHCRHTYEF